MPGKTRDAKPKYEFIEPYLSAFDIVILEETWLKDSPFGNSKVLKDWKWLNIPSLSNRSCGMLLGYKSWIKLKKDIAGHIKNEDREDKKRRSRDSEERDPNDGLTEEERIKIIKGFESQWISAEFEVDKMSLQIVGLYRHHNTKFEAVETAFQRMLSLSKTTPLLLIGDMNVRIGGMGAWPDKTKNRNCRDKHTDSKGLYTSFLQLLETCKLIVLNGQTRGDEEGEYTREEAKSTVDFGAANEKLREKIEQFKVDTIRQYESDHYPLTLKIRIREDPVSDLYTLQSLNDLMQRAKEYTMSLTVAFIKFSSKVDLIAKDPMQHVQWSERGVKVNHLRVNHLKTNDTIVILAEDFWDAGKMIQELKKASEKEGLQIVTSESGILSNHDDPQTIKIDGKELKIENSFVFLDQFMTFASDSTTHEVTRRIKLAQDLLGSQKNPDVEKIYETLLYGCETWCLTSDLLKKINSSNKDMGKALGSKAKNVVETLLQRKHDWAGRLSRGSSNASEINHWVPEGLKKRSGHSANWEDDLHKALGDNWRSLASDVKEWNSTCQEKYFKKWT